MANEKTITKINGYTLKDGVLRESFNGALGTIDENFEALNDAIGEVENKFDSLYWANVSVSDKSNENTSPTFATVKAKNNVLPWSNKGANLGNASYQWGNIYGKTIYEDGTSLANKYKVSVTPSVTSGTKIADITVGGTTQTLYAPKSATGDDIPTNYVTTNTAQTISGTKTFNAPTNSSGNEQATTWFNTANGGRIGFGKEGANSGTAIFLDQEIGTRRLNFRGSWVAGSIVWEQPEANSKLYYDVSNVEFRKTDNIQLTKFASAGYLYTDASGNLKKGTLPTVPTVSGTSGTIPKFTGTNSIGNSCLTQNGNNDITVGGKFIVNSNGSTSGNSYNEGIRVLPASNGWCELFFANDQTTSGTHAKGWVLGKRGAVGSTSGTAGDFTIECNGSSGTGLTLYADGANVPRWNNSPLCKQVKINGTTYNASTAGLIDLGTISGGSGTVSGDYVTHKTQTATVLGTSKTTEAIGAYQLVFPNGGIFSGTAQNAGLVTRGICGVTSPDGNGGCEKENLFINYDGSNTYQSNRQLVLQAGAVGTHYGNNLYQYCAARGDAVKMYVDARKKMTSVAANTEVQYAQGVYMIIPEATSGTFTITGGGTITVKAYPFFVYNRLGSGSPYYIDYVNSNGTAVRKNMSSYNGTSAANITKLKCSVPVRYISLGTI